MCVCFPCSIWTCWKTVVEWGKAPFWFCSVTFVSISLDPQLANAIDWAGRVISFLWGRGNDRCNKCDDIIASNTSSWVTMVTAYTHRLTSCTDAHVNNINCAQHKQVWDRINMGIMYLQWRVETQRHTHTQKLILQLWKFLIMTDVIKLSSWPRLKTHTYASTYAHTDTRRWLKGYEFHTTERRCQHTN